MELQYEDPEFPATHASIYGDDGGEGAPIEWRRPEPHAVLVASNRPALFAPGGHDLPAAFLGALAAVARHPDALLRNLFADAVDSHEWGVTGGLTCRLYHQGEWVEVPIDTRVPYRAAPNAGEGKDASEGKDADADGSVPAFGACEDPAEMWVQFAVKAYAKMTGQGRYGTLKDVSIADALVDLTGGASETALLHSKGVREMVDNGGLWRKLKRFFKFHYILTYVYARTDRNRDESVSPLCPSPLTIALFLFSSHPIGASTSTTRTRTAARATRRKKSASRTAAACSTTARTRCCA